MRSTKREWANLNPRTGGVRSTLRFLWRSATTTRPSRLPPSSSLAETNCKRRQIPLTSSTGRRGVRFPDELGNPCAMADRRKLSAGISEGNGTQRTGGSSVHVENAARKLKTQSEFWNRLSQWRLQQRSLVRSLSIFAKQRTRRKDRSMFGIQSVE